MCGGAKPRFFWPFARLQRVGGRLPLKRRTVGGGRHRSGVTRAGESTGSDGGRHRRGRGARHRQWFGVWWASCRTVCLQGKTYPPNAGAFMRANGGRRRPARLCIDLVHPRTTYPPRESHQQYLHEFRAVCFGVYDAFKLAWRARANPACRIEPCPSDEVCRFNCPGSRLQGCQSELFQ